MNIDLKEITKKNLLVKEIILEKREHEDQIQITIFFVDETLTKQTMPIRSSIYNEKVIADIIISEIAKNAYRVQQNLHIDDLIRLYMLQIPDIKQFKLKVKEKKREIRCRFCNKVNLI